jgi:hypothetical protein
LDHTQLPLLGHPGVFVPPPPPQVTVAHPRLQPVIDLLNFTGNTQAIKTVQLRAWPLVLLVVEHDQVQRISDPPEANTWE